MELTKKDLQELVSSAVTAAIESTRAPQPPTAKEQAEIKQAQADRAQMADSVKKVKINQRAFQQICAHRHSAVEGSHSHCVYVHDNSIKGSPGFIYCQKCQIRVRPVDTPKGFDGQYIDHEAVYDNALYNRLFQELNSADIVGV